MTEPGPTPETTDDAADHAHAHIGIVTALPMEAAPFLGGCERRRSYSGARFKFCGGVIDDDLRVVVVQGAVGFAKARAATQALIDAHTPDWILSCGFSGALAEGLQIGDIVLANSIVDQHGHELRVDLKMESDAKRRLHVGRCLTADELILKVDDKRRLGEQHDAIAVDLESLAVAQVCKELGQRFMSIRTISDDLSEDLPKEILSIMGDTGSMRVGAALGAVWKRFGSVKDMWHLRERAMTASRRLAKFLNGVLPQLVPSNTRKG